MDIHFQMVLTDLDWSVISYEQWIYPTHRFNLGLFISFKTELVIQYQLHPVNQTGGIYSMVEYNDHEQPIESFYHTTIKR